MSHDGILCIIKTHYTDFPMFFKRFTSIFKNKRIYLDYASSTPVDREMVSSFPRIPDDCVGANPSALHKEGVSLKRVLMSARALVAKTLGAQVDEIIFTSNASESDNLAIVGAVKSFLQKGTLPEEIVVYTSPFEHSAVKESVASLSTGVIVRTLLQDQGFVITKNLVVPEGSKVILVSVMMVQNEIGTLQDIKDIAKHIRKLRKEHPYVEILFHTDATQAPLFYDLNVARLGIDMMTLGATKLYCQKGAGMLYKKRGVSIAPIIYGGGQESGLRPGTEPVELIHQFSYALAYAQKYREQSVEKITVLQKYFERKVKEALPHIRITGEESLRSPHISHLVIPKIDSELLVIELDARGIALSSKSACKNEDSNESELLTLLYPNEVLGAIRVSYGRKTTKQELDKTLIALQSVIKKYDSNA